jgi:hypothetical protein
MFAVFELVLNDRVSIPAMRIKIEVLIWSLNRLTVRDFNSFSETHIHTA